MDYSYSNGTEKNLILKKYPCLQLFFPLQHLLHRTLPCLVWRPQYRGAGHWLLVEVSQLPGAADRLWGSQGTLFLKHAECR